MSDPFLCLGIESTAHTFSVGIVDDRGNVLGLASDTYFPPQGGLKPNDVVEHHYVVFVDQLKKALRQAGIKIHQIQLIAFSQGPGLGPCLRIGAAVARTLAQKLKVPLVGVNHCIAHVEIGRQACGCEDPLTVYVSGGNTIISAFESGRYQIFGETIDISLGNLLDMVARDVGIAHPGGPRIEKLAKQGDHYYEFPYVVKGMDLSYSGLYSFSRKFIENHKIVSKSQNNPKILPGPEHSNNLNNQKESLKAVFIEDLAYSLQETAFAMLGEVCERAIAHTHKKSVLLTGGVAANHRLQQLIENICKHHNVDFHVVPKKLAGDNGAMIAWTGLIQYQSGSITTVEESTIIPKWRMDAVPIPWRCSPDRVSPFSKYQEEIGANTNLNNYNYLKASEQLYFRALFNEKRDNLRLWTFLGNDSKIIAHGAEAILYQTSWFDRSALLKFRIPKPYRIQAVDNPLRFQRTVTEARILMALHDSKVSVPMIYDVIPTEAALVMEYITGSRLKDIITHLSSEDISNYCRMIGKYLAIMHNLNISHGDLTTSNVLITHNGDLFLIDFGLSLPDVGVEEMAMDIHLFYRVVLSSHGKYYDLMIPPFLSGYQENIAGNFAEIMDRVEKIRLRGRYISKTLRKQPQQKSMQKENQ